MKIYIASHDKWAALHWAAELSNAGHGIASTWHDVPFTRTDEIAPDDRPAVAFDCVQEIESADALLLLTPHGDCPGGIYAEAGVALSQGLPVFLVGRRSNLMLWHPDVVQCDEVQGVLEAMADASAVSDDLPDFGGN